MARASWTYELPLAGSSAENLDDYEARTADGAHAGIVTGLVERGGARYVLLDAGPLPPLLHRRLAVRWEDVAEVDHDALVVELGLERARVGEAALALDPALARHDDSAEAARVHELPPELAHSAAPGLEGPVEGASAFAVLATAMLGPWSVLVVVAVWSARGLAGWELAAFAVPLLLTLLAIAVAGYRLYRAPHVGHHAHGVHGGASGGTRAALPRG